MMSDRFKTQEECVRELQKLRAELEQAKAENTRLQRENDANAFSITPAMYEARIDQHVADKARLAAALLSIRDDCGTGYAEKVAANALAAMERKV
jgi:hypothetical protein